MKDGRFWLQAYHWFDNGVRHRCNLPVEKLVYVSTIQNLDKARASAWQIHDNCNEEQNKDKLAALKIIVNCNVERFKLLTEGPSIMAAKALDEKVDRIQKEIANKNG